MTILSADDLDLARLRGDPLIDPLITTQLELGGASACTLEEMERLAQQGNEIAYTFTLPLNIAPDWVNWSLIERGRRVFVRTHVLSTSALLLGGMIDSYTNPQIARVLVHSGRLIESANRRVFETGQMVYDTHLPHGLRPKGQGVRTLLKIRLLHAVIRARINHHMAKHHYADNHVHSVREDPINQEDSLFTLMMFNVMVIRGLRSLGVEISAKDLQAYQHFWCYVGWILGVEYALLPKRYEDADALYDLIKSRHCEYGQNAQELTHALIQGVAGGPPFFLPANVLAALARHFLGDESADALQLPKSRFAPSMIQRLKLPLGLFGRILASRGLVESISLQVGQSYGAFVIAWGLKKSPATFEASS